MEQEYTVPIGWRIFYGLLAIMLIGLSVFVLVKPTSATVVAAMLLATAGGMILINQFKSKLRITDTSIIRTTVFGTTELFINDIKGFRIGDKVIVIEPLNPGYKKLKIGDYISIGNVNELKNWLRNNFRDLAQEEFEAEKEQILHNSNLGFSEQDREAKFKRMANLSMVYNLAGIGFIFLFIYVFIDSRYPDIFLLLYPLTGIVIVYFSRGLVTLISKRSSAYTNVILGLYTGVLILIARSFTYYHITNKSNLAIPAVVLSLPFLSVLIFRGFNKTYSSRLGQLLLMLILSGGYGVGAALNINCFFDSTEPKIYAVTVTDRHISHKKTTTYHIQLSGWNNHNEGESITVPASFYNQATIGSKVDVMEKPGLFKMPWYYVGQ